MIMHMIGRKKFASIVALQVVMLAGLFVVHSPKASAAACAAPATDYGSVTGISVNIPSTGTYRVWSRIAVPNTTDNSYLIEVSGPSGTFCANVGGNASIPVSSGMTAPLNWKWIDYKDGATGTKNDMQLNQGAYTVKLIGNKPNVAVDRVIFTANLSCVPDDVKSTNHEPGDNCANPPDTTPPAVTLTSPAAGNVTGTSINISATATDDSGVINRVEFLVDGQIVNTDTAAPFTYTHPIDGLPVGNHTVRARAFDGAGLSTSTADRTITIADTQAPTGVTVTAPAANKELKGTETVSVTASDNVGVAKAELFVNAETVAVATDTSPPFSMSFNTTTRANGSYTLKLVVSDAAGNKASATVPVTINNPVTPPPDTTPPQAPITAPTAGQVISGSAFQFSASPTDNVKVTKVEFFVDDIIKASPTDPPFTATIDTTAYTNGSHSFHVIAYDAAGNKSTIAKINATITNTTFLKEDVNMNKKVDMPDLIAIAVKFGQTGANLGRADVKTDLVINMQDLIAVAVKFGATSP